MARSWILAAVLAAALAAWLASGQPEVLRLLGAAPPPAPESEAQPAAPAERPLPRVRVTTSRAEPIRREIVVYGRTEAKRDVTLRAETYGRVDVILVDKGQRVEAGEPLLRMDGRERAAMVAQAEALVRQRELEYQAASQLGARGFQAETQVAEAEALLEAARAELRTREVALENTEVRAPFAGLLVDRYGEVGDYLDTADPAARLIQDDPFLVTGEIAETQRRLVELGMPVHVELADGGRHDGRLTFVSATAEAATRTFRIEAEVDGAAGIPTGMSATMRLRFAEVAAHRLSAALLSLDADHRLGVKLVDDDDRVRFAPVEIVRADAEAVWLSGLPPTARVIIVGQGFVHDGERVVPVAVENAAVAAAGLSAGAGR